MARLCVTPGCRFQTLLAEFGEGSEACGRCDHCRGGPLAWARRAGALSLRTRVAAESLLNRPASEDADEEPASPEPPASEERVLETAPPPELTIAQARLLRALEAERLRIAKRRGAAPRTIASEATLRALAISRPNRLDDPLFAQVWEPAAFLKLISSGD